MIIQTIDFILFLFATFVLGFLIALNLVAFGIIKRNYKKKRLEFEKKGDKG